MIQCVAVIVVHFFEASFSSERWDLLTTLLALVVCLSALMYQVGRRLTSLRPCEEARAGREP